MFDPIRGEKEKARERELQYERDLGELGERAAMAALDESIYPETVTILRAVGAEALGLRRALARHPSGTQR